MLLQQCSELGQFTDFDTLEKRVVVVLQLLLAPNYEIWVGIAKHLLRREVGKLSLRKMLFAKCVYVQQLAEPTLELPILASFPVVDLHGIPHGLAIDFVIDEFQRELRLHNLIII